MAQEAPTLNLVHNTNLKAKLLMLTTQHRPVATCHIDLDQSHTDQKWLYDRVTEKNTLYQHEIPIFSLESRPR